jgi:hypothetical protein
MRKLWLAAPLLGLLIGCSKNEAPETAAAPAAESPAAQAPAKGHTKAPGKPAEHTRAGEPGRPSDALAAAANSAGEARREPAAPVRVPLVVPAGTALRVRIDSALDTKQNQAGDKFTASLDEAVTVDGKTAIPKGAILVGHVTSSASSGRIKGKAGIAITLDTVEVAGRKHEIETDSVGHESSGHKKRNIGLIGGGAALGAALGAIAGGGKGAAIGAAAGAGAGTAGAVATGKQDASIASESVASFSLKAPVTIQ